MLKFIKSIDKDALFLSLMILGPCVNYNLNAVIQSGLGMGSISMPVYILLALIGIYSYTYLKKVPVLVQFISILIPIMTIVSWISYPPISHVILADGLNPLDSGLLFIVLYSIPLLIYASIVKNVGTVLKYLYILSLPNVIFAFISYYFMVFQALEDAQIGYLTFAYNALTSICVCVLYGFIYKKIYSIILGLALFVLIFFVGSRGASVCFACFCLLLYLKFAKFTKKTISVLTLIVVFLLVVIYNFEPIANAVLDVTKEQGTNAYALSKILSGDYFDSSGRDEIGDMLMDKIYAFPFGYGLFGDRYIYHLCNQEVSTSSYAHNFLIEILSHFGLVFGLVVFLGIFSLLYKGYKSKNIQLSLLVMVLIPAGFVKLFFSGSYLLSFEFWPLIGLCLNKVRQININRLYR